MATSELQLLEQLSSAGNDGLLLRSVTQSNDMSRMGGGFHLAQADYETLKSLGAEGKLSLFLVSKVGVLGEFNSIDEERAKLSPQGAQRLAQLRKENN